MWGGYFKFFLVSLIAEHMPSRPGNAVGPTNKGIAAFVDILQSFRKWPERDTMSQLE